MIILLTTLVITVVGIIVGYGLDYDGKYRQFKDIKIVRTDNE